MSGLPGVGKSTLAAQVASYNKVTLLPVDDIESAIVKASTVRGADTWRAADLVAETLVQAQVKLGNSVIVDCVNASEEAKQGWIDFSKRLDVRLVVIECVLEDTALHRERLEARTKGLFGIEEVTWDKAEATRKTYTEWQIDTLKLDMGDDLQDNIGAVLNFIATI